MSAGEGKLRVLELFAGLGGGSSAFRERGHYVVTTDLDPSFGCTVTGDILDPRVVAELLALGPYDFVWASPPCEGFSVMNIGRNWTRPTDPIPNAPKTETAALAVRLVAATNELIERLAPFAFVIENPRAKLRRLPVVAHLERRTVTYCQYGESYMKPTDLWGGFPPSLRLRPTCSNGAPCHESAPRGSKKGIQGIASSAERAKVPYELSLDVCLAVEADFASGARVHVGEPVSVPVVEQASLFESEAREYDVPCDHVCDVCREAVDALEARPVGSFVVLEGGDDLPYQVVVAADTTYGGVIEEGTLVFATYDVDEAHVFAESGPRSEDALRFCSSMARLVVEAAEEREERE